MNLFNEHQLAKAFADGRDIYNDTSRDIVKAFITAHVLNDLATNHFGGLLEVQPRHKVPHGTEGRRGILSFEAQLHEDTRMRGGFKYNYSIVATVVGEDISGSLMLVHPNKRYAGEIVVQGSSSSKAPEGNARKVRMNVDYVLPETQRMLLLGPLMELEALFAKAEFPMHDSTAKLSAPRRLKPGEIYYMDSPHQEEQAWALGDPVLLINQIDGIHVSDNGDICDCMIYNTREYGRKIWTHSSCLFTQAELLMNNSDDARRQEQMSRKEQPHSEFLDAALRQLAKEFIRVKMADDTKGTQSV